MSRSFPVPVIHPRHLPSRMPLLHTAVAWLALDRFDYPPVASGVVWTLVAIVWLGWLVSFGMEETKAPAEIRGER